MGSSLNPICSPRQQTAAERSMSWMVTQLYSVVASRPTRGQRGAHLSVATTTVGWRGFGYQEKRTRRAPLGGYVLVDYSSSGTAATPAAAAVSHIVKYKIPRRVDSARLSAARPKKGSQSWLGRLGPTRSAAHPARLFAASDHDNSGWSRRLLESVRAQ